jgi:hypothetical protein
LRQRHGFEHGFPLIRSLRASAQRSTSVLFSFVLFLLIVAGASAIPQSKRLWRDPVTQAVALAIEVTGRYSGYFLTRILR